MIKIYLCVQFLMFLGSLFLYWKLASKKVGFVRKDRFDWMLQNKKWFGAAHVALAVVVTVPFVKPMANTTWCWYKGVEHSVDTRRDLISGRCLYHGAGGEWIPINRLIGAAEGNDKSQEVNDANQLIMNGQ